jgi:hypothetical protein
MEKRTVPADIILLANGYDIQNWFHPLKVTGRNGEDLIHTMEERGGPQAYQGTAMDGFPNFFIIFGPNTAQGHTSVIMASENMIEYSLHFIRPLLKGDVEKVEVKREAEEAYTKDIQNSLKNTVFMSGGCRSWYYTDGWNSTVLPYSQIWYWYRCMFPRWRDWDITYTRKGQVKIALARAIRVLALASAILGVYWARKSGVGVKGQAIQILATLRDSSKAFVEAARNILTRKA